ncbi:hypothetical protein [Pseudonocardia sp. ICBG1293]|uniref:hypothetical protein n=1 Tax=Pseudonocardia sp. ICBG1293 TaxID=2844382 RepID=UPI001CCA7268|nr:hypothetical protein [Pseudonocardia sp. ICBG1293]
MIAISVGVLALVIAVSAWRAINLGALALAATWVVGVLIGGESAADVLGSFPSDLFVMIVGVTLLFGVARANGTVDRVVQGTFRLVRGRRTALPASSRPCCVRSGRRRAPSPSS